jgi:spore maturation protein CgeB
VIVYRTEAERDALVEQAFATGDWVIKCSGVGVWDAELEAAVAERSGGGARTAFLDVDAPATLARIAADGGDAFRGCIPRYDHVFTYGGGPPVLAAYAAWGAQGCTCIYNGLDPEEHRPLEVAAHPGFVLLFMGNRLPDREARVDEFFFRAASLSPGRRFVLGGEGWGDRPMPANVRYLGHVYTRDHNAFTCTPLTVLNISRESMARYGFSPATRVFEAAGAGACLITDEWVGIEMFLEPGREVLVARDGDEVAGRLRELTPERARRIGEAARRRVLSEHTYAHRAAQVESVLGIAGGATQSLLQEATL